jgi:hypothetical protein
MEDPERRRICDSFRAYQEGMRAIQTLAVGAVEYAGGRSIRTETTFMRPGYVKWVDEEGRVVVSDGVMTALPNGTVRPVKKSDFFLCLLLQQNPLTETAGVAETARDLRRCELSEDGTLRLHEENRAVMRMTVKGIEYSFDPDSGDIVCIEEGRSKGSPSYRLFLQDYREVAYPDAETGKEKTLRLPGKMIAEFSGGNNECVYVFDRLEVNKGYSKEFWQFPSARPDVEFGNLPLGGG